ncbi:hypothetical protein AGMMS50293_02560 [Spirochaetia bacterium]|nr:hypothetical protein AGMMS50293_02560 [Spirochaetia bacterium]
MQNEITKMQDVPGKDGNIIEAGWARQELFHYKKENIHHPAKRLKEWSYFFCGDENFGIGFNIANVGPIHNYGLSFMDFKNHKNINDSSIIPVEGSVLDLPSDPFGSLKYKAPNTECEIAGSREKILFKSEWRKFGKEADFSINLTLHMPQGDTLFHCFPFTKGKGEFFYSHKMDNIRVSGSFTLGSLTYTFDPALAFGVQDWGRGIWPSETHAYWGGGNGMVNGKQLSFNIGYDYKWADLSSATENALFYDGVIHKLTGITFKRNEKQKEWLDPWNFSSSDGRFEMIMKPIMDRFTQSPLGPSHQCFGYYSGSVILDNGKKLAIEKLFGFAEKNVYKWGLVETVMPPLLAVQKLFSPKKGQANIT